MKNIFLALSLFIGAVAVYSGAEAQNKPAHGHEHFSGPPHGGTPVQVGDHAYHLELVRNAKAGKFQAFVLDGHMEHYREVAEKSFEMVANVGTKKERVSFARLPNPGAAASSEKSYLFEGSAEWIKTATNFSATVPLITLNGKSFTNITFSFPKGKAHAH